MADGRRGLPVVLVSASDAAAAAALVDELIDNEVPASEAAGGARVWRLVNKYYRADVRVCPRANDAPAHAIIEAHVVHLAPHELDAATLERRSAVATGARYAVRLALAECAVAPAELRRAALALHYELVPLREPPPTPPDRDHDVEPRGILRARAALHAHVWPGLQRLDRAAAPASSMGSGDGDSSSGGEEQEDEEGAVERAELFAEAWGALEGARGAALQADAGAGMEERRARAEQLVAAFCRALGHDLDAL